MSYLLAIIEAWQKGDFEKIAGLNTVKGAHPNISIRNTSYFQDKQMALNKSLQEIISQNWPLLVEAGKSLSAARDVDAVFREEDSRRDSVLTSLQEWLKKSVGYNAKPKVNALAPQPQPSPIAGLVEQKLNQEAKNQQERENARLKAQRAYEQKLKETIDELRKEISTIQKSAFSTEKGRNQRLVALNNKWVSMLGQLEKNSQVGTAVFKADAIPPLTDEQIEQYAQREALYQVRPELEKLLPTSPPEEYL